jgi:Peptidase family M48
MELSALMTRKRLLDLSPETYQHSFDRKALASLEKMPGLPLLLKKINEYGLDRLLRLQTIGSTFRVTPRNFPKLYQAFVEASEILDIAPSPELFLYRGTGHINTYAIGVEKPLITVNLEAMEWLSADELLFVFGHELARIKGRYLVYQQLVTVMPLLKNLIGSTTLGLGGLVANGLEVALYNWIIMAKFTADRAGLLACQNRDVAISALMKLGGLPDHYLTPEVTADFIAQAREFDIQTLDNLDRVTKLFSFMEYQLPWMVMRGSELLSWGESEDYTQILYGANRDGKNSPNSPEDPQPSEQSEDNEDWEFLSSW